MTKTTSFRQIAIKQNGNAIPNAPGKARSRYSRKTHTFRLPDAYRAWKEDFTSQLIAMKMEIVSVEKEIYFPLERVEMQIILRGHNMKQDIDNTAGSILDSLQQSDWIRNDNMTVVPSLNIKHRMYGSGFDILLTEAPAIKKDSIALFDIVKDFPDKDRVYYKSLLGWSERKINSQIKILSGLNLVKLSEDKIVAIPREFTEDIRQFKFRDFFVSFRKSSPII